MFYFCTQDQSQRNILLNYGKVYFSTCNHVINKLNQQQLAHFIAGVVEMASKTLINETRVGRVWGRQWIYIYFLMVLLSAEAMFGGRCPKFWLGGARKYCGFSKTLCWKEELLFSKNCYQTIISVTKEILCNTPPPITHKLFISITL